MAIAILKPIQVSVPYRRANIVQKGNLDLYDRTALDMLISCSITQEMKQATSVIITAFNTATVELTDKPDVYTAMLHKQRHLNQNVCNGILGAAIKMSSYFNKLDNYHHSQYSCILKLF